MNREDDHYLVPISARTLRMSFTSIMMKDFNRHIIDGGSTL